MISWNFSNITAIPTPTPSPTSDRESRWQLFCFWPRSPVRDLPSLVKNENDRKKFTNLSEIHRSIVTEGEPIYKDYQTVGRILNSTIRAKERGWLKRIQEEYDAIAPIIDIQR